MQETTPPEDFSVNFILNTLQVKQFKLAGQVVHVPALL
jgi:hypothetical protein